MDEVFGVIRSARNQGWPIRGSKNKGYTLHLEEALDGKTKLLWLEEKWEIVGYGNSEKKIIQKTIFFDTG